MDARDSLRLSILVALGLPGCAGAAQTSSSADGSTSVVAIAPSPSVVSIVEPVGSSEPGIPVISAKKGWLTESNGNVHRATVTTCDPTIAMPACAGTEGYLQCRTDGDCTDGPHGKCVSGVGQVGSYCGCEYACANDAECGDDSVCVCNGLGRVGNHHSVCAEASCKTDSDCPSKACGLSVYNNGCSSVVTLLCRTKDDSCKSDMDCPGETGQCVQSRNTESPKWACETRSCAIGRPLFVNGQACSAPAKYRDDWLRESAFDGHSFPAESRRVATAHYLQIAALEHASVASFSRFSLQLMALGAPAELLRDAHCAALDEIEHARTAYVLATRFGEKNLGPDKLPAAIAPIEIDISAFVKALVREGCVGETLGAAEGRMAAELTIVPEIARDLTKIADDEERHAILAWRTLQWAIETFGIEARNAAMSALDEARRQYATDPDVEVAMESLGILSGKSLGILRRDVLSSVIGPCAKALGIVFPSSDQA